MSFEGRNVGRYRIDSFLGSGWTGQVFRATRRDNGLPGAVKVFARFISSDPILRPRFEHAVQAARALRHPNVVEIDEFEEADGRLFVAMELFDHGSLRTLLQRAAGTGQPMPLDLGVDIVRQAAEGVGFAHDLGVAHGDLKPENILLMSARGPDSSARWTAKVTDFGVGRISGMISRSQNELSIDERKYEAPEQRDGSDPSPRGDVFSLGAILYEVVTSQHLAMPENLDGDQLLARLRALNPAQSPAIGPIIVRCLAEEPQQRFANGNELASALDPIGRSQEPHTRLDADEGQHATRPPLEIAAIGDRITLDGDMAASISLSIANRGDEDVDVQVKCDSTQTFAFPDLPRLLRLNAGQQKSMALKVLLAANTYVVPGDYRVPFTVAVKQGAMESSEVAVRVHVLPQPVATLSIRRLGNDSGRRAVYQIEVSNRGHVVEHFALTASDENGRLHYALKPQMVTLEPGRSRSATLTVTDRWRGPKRGAVDFCVTATPSSGPDTQVPSVFSRSTRPFAEARRAIVGFGVLGVAAVIILALFVRSAVGGPHQGSAVILPTSTTAATQTPRPTPIPTPSPTNPPRTPPATVSSAGAASPTEIPAKQTPIAVKSVTTSARVVAITFSIGNDPSSAAKVTAILKTLRDRNVVASFGVPGNWAADHPDLVKSIVADGNQLIDETYDEKSFTGRSSSQAALTSAARIQELTKADQIFQQITGKSTRPYYRPPFGDIDLGPNSSVEKDAAKAGFTVAVLWSVDTRSWSASQTVGQMIATASAAKPGNIILFSVSTAGGDKDVSALPQIIDNLHSSGYEFATVGQLVGR